MWFTALIAAGAVLVIGTGIYLCSSPETSTEETKSTDNDYKSANPNDIINSQDKIEQNSEKVEDSQDKIEQNSVMKENPQEYIQDFFHVDPISSDNNLTSQQEVLENISEEVNTIPEQETPSQENELENINENSQYFVEEDQELNDIKIDYINLPFAILPPGTLERDIYLWLEKNYKNKYEYDKQLEIMNFLRNFNPVIIARGQCFEQKDNEYIIMIFEKSNNKKIAVAESGEYGNATYYYETYSDNNSEWVQVFSMDKQNARRKARRIYHDYTNHLYSWKYQIKSLLKNYF